MCRRLATAAAVLAALCGAQAARAGVESYRFDPVHTQVWFATEHQGFSRPLGRLRVKDGWFQFDEKDWTTARVDVTIDVAAADMGDEKWSTMVRSGQFLDTERWPSARYVSRSVEKTAERDGIIHGDLYLRDRKQPVDITFRLNRIANDPYSFARKAGFSAQATLSRRAFGIERYAEVVGANVELRLEIEGIRDGDAAKKKEADDADQKR